MAGYKRPYFDRYCRTRKRKSDPQYPYSAAMLRKYDALELFPLDGGGFFFTQELVGGLKTKQFLSALRSGKLLAPWKVSGKAATTPDNIDWMACYDESKPGGYKYQIVEQHVWLQRWYFMLPLAQEFLRTGKKKYVSQWFAFFKSWHDTFGDEEYSREVLQAMGQGRRRALTDMQSVWRLMVLIHSVEMFAGRPGALRPDQWADIYRAIEKHGRRTYREGRRQMAKGGGKNHFLHKGTALVYVGTLFPEFEGADTWVKLGSRIMRWYLLHNTNTDGGSVEACPTYSHFIARLYLDSYLLLKANRRPQVKGLRQCIDSQYRFLADTATPEWLTLAWGDSYSLDVRCDLEIVRDVFPFRMPARTRSVVYSESQVAVLRDKNTVVYVDAMPGGLWHIHRGKPHIEVFYRGKPVLIDSGCVNYDREAEREGYMKTRGAHNVVTVEPVENDEWPGTSTFYEMGELESGGKSVTAKCMYRGKGTKYTWTRTITLRDDVVELVDKVTSRKPMKCVLHFHLAESRVRARKDGFSARNGWSLACTCANAVGKKLRSSVKRSLAIDDANERFKAPDVSFRQSGNKVVFKTVLQLDKA